MDLSHKTKKTLLYVTGLLSLFAANMSFAETIVIYPNTVVSFPKTYNNVTLDMSNGSFIIKNKANLTITNSNIIGTVSDKTPVLITVDGSGSLNMTGNKVTITSKGIPAHPTTQSLNYVIQVATGSANLTGNSFTVDKAYTLGLFLTTPSIPTLGIKIQNNNVTNFHGVFYLIGSDDAVINNNVLTKNSYGNIVLFGNNGTISGNTVSFSGNDKLGNAIDVIDSDTVTVSKNLIMTPTCHAIYVIKSDNISLDSNRIFGGITYAINAYSRPEVFETDAYVMELMSKFKLRHAVSSNISITNNFMSQNRYGVSAGDINGLTISNNTFIQRFTTDKSRKFWTNNNVLLTNISGLVWTNNTYKEAYTQEVNGDNSKSKTFIPFPQSGGVSL